MRALICFVPFFLVLDWWHWCGFDTVSHNHVHGSKVGRFRGKVWLYADASVTIWSMYRIYCGKRAANPTSCRSNMVQNKPRLGTV